MKKTVQILFFVLTINLIPKVIFGTTCIPSGTTVTLTTQAQVDAFPINYPGCTIAEGEVTIIGNDITNLNGLDNLTTVNSLYIYYNDALTSLNGLNNLTTVNSLNIYGNNALTSLSGLNNLTTVNSSYIYDNYALTSLSGLNNLTTVNSLYIYGNNSLTSLNDLNNLATVNSLHIQNNDALTSLNGLNNLTAVFLLSIASNTNLIDISQLNKTNITYGLDIINNSSLKCCDVVNGIISRSSSLINISIYDNLPGCNSITEVQNTINTNCCNKKYTFLKDTICSGDTIFFNNQKLTTTGTYNDTIKKAGSCDSIIITNLTVTTPTSTTQNATICQGKTYTLPSGKIVNIAGIYNDTIKKVGTCDSIIITNLTVTPNNFIVSLPNTDTINLGNSIELKPIYVNQTPANWLWQNANTLSCTTCEKPMANPTTTTTYTVKVTAQNSCDDTAQTTIFVRQSNIYIPTAFTPNNDGINDEFTIFANNLNSFQLKIFNRWGELVFETTDITNKWNGIFKGKDAPVDSYVYIIDAILKTNEKIQKKGIITLLR